MLSLNICALLASAAFGASSLPVNQIPPSEPTIVEIERPVEQRVKVASAWRIDQLHGFLGDKPDASHSYRAYMPTAIEKQALARAIAGLPLRLQKALREHLIAIFFVSGIHFNTEHFWMQDSVGQFKFYWIVNPDVFRQTLSDVLTQRDRRLFASPPSVVVDAGKGGSGITYVVARESAVVYDYVYNLTPYPDPDIAEVTNRPLQAAWEIWDGYDKPNRLNDYSSRSRMRKWTAEEAAQVYSDLSHTEFPSLVASANWSNDLSDLFFFRHLTVDLKRPYRIRVRGADGQETMYEPMSDPRVQERAERILEPIYR